MGDLLSTDTDIFTLDNSDLWKLGLTAIEMLPMAFAIRAKDLVARANPEELKTIAEALTIAFGPTGIVAHAATFRKLKESGKSEK